MRNYQAGNLLWVMCSESQLAQSYYVFCVMVGDGVQIMGMTTVTIIFAVLVFMSTGSQRMFLTGIIILYLFLGIAAGYVTVQLWRAIKGDSEGWRSVSWSISCFLPRIVFVILIILNFILRGRKSTGIIFHGSLSFVLEHFPLEFFSSNYSSFSPAFGLEGSIMCLVSYLALFADNCLC